MNYCTGFYDGWKLIFHGLLRKLQKGAAFAVTLQYIKYYFSTTSLIAASSSS